MLSAKLEAQFHEKDRCHFVDMACLPVKNDCLPVLTIDRFGELPLARTIAGNEQIRQYWQRIKLQADIAFYEILRTDAMN